jgi:mono/diheme cytochrome c family protein
MIPFSVLFFFCTSAVCRGATDEGQHLFEQKCSACHGIKKSTSKIMTEAEWHSITLRMKSNGADLSRQEIETIITYLAKNYLRK